VRNEQVGCDQYRRRRCEVMLRSAPPAK
jgi:hypothetical protein